MNNSTVKSVVLVGLLFLAGLVVLSFINFVAFSPTTKRLQVIANQYEVTAKNTCQKNCDIQIKINNKSDEKITFVIDHIVGLDGGYFCQSSEGYRGGVIFSVPPKEITVTCQNSTTLVANKVCYSIRSPVAGMNEKYIVRSCVDVR